MSETFAFENRLMPGGASLLHDSVGVHTSRIYGREKACKADVVDFVVTPKQRPDLQVFDFRCGRGVTLVR